MKEKSSFEANEMKKFRNVIENLAQKCPQRVP